jgi:carbonic anhydrase
LKRTVSANLSLDSIEYAVEHLNVPLVVVMGHDSCGAVTAVVMAEKHQANLGSLVNYIIILNYSTALLRR